MTVTWKAEETRCGSCCNGCAGGGGGGGYAPVEWGWRPRLLRAASDDVGENHATSGAPRGLLRSPPHHCRCRPPNGHSEYSETRSIGSTRCSSSVPDIRWSWVVMITVCNSSSRWQSQPSVVCGGLSIFHRAASLLQARFQVLEPLFEEGKIANGGRW